MHHDDLDDGLTATNGRYFISDRDLDALAEASMAYELWEQRRRWWLVGCIDDRRSLDTSETG